MSETGLSETGSGSKRYRLAGNLVFAMEVAEVLTYQQYWQDVRFQRKKPYLRGSLKQAFGDNIYHRDSETGTWLQEDSHHSHRDGSSNQANIDHDTRVSRILVASEFNYWGAYGPKIPGRFRKFLGFDVCCSTQGHKCNFPVQLMNSFVEWLKSINDAGFIGEPMEFKHYRAL